jgi:hypothetical protein
VADAEEPIVYTEELIYAYYDLYGKLATDRALDDDRISQTELADIAQLGANASAGLNAHGGPQLQRLAGSINDITGQIARGQMPQARANVGNLEASLGTRSSRP